MIYSGLKVSNIAKEHPTNLQTDVNDPLNKLQPKLISNNVSTIVHKIKTSAPNTQKYVKSIFHQIGPTIKMC